MSATHKIVNGVEVALSPAEIAAIEAEWTDNAPGTGSVWLADQTATRDKLRNLAKTVFADSDGDVQALAKAMRALALLVLDEINILRTQLGLANRTIAQLKTAMRNKIDAGNADS